MATCTAKELVLTARRGLVQIQVLRFTCLSTARWSLR
jgi:hypothetical protein